MEAAIGAEMGLFQWLIVAVAIITGCGIPILIHNLSRQDSDRRAKFNEMHTRMDHLDNCLDSLRNTVLGTAVRREDFVALKADTIESLNRMRSAISNETNGLHDRIMRLENKTFGMTGD